MVKHQWLFPDGSPPHGSTASVTMPEGTFTVYVSLDTKVHAEFGIVTVKRSAETVIAEESTSKVAPPLMGFSTSNVILVPVVRTMRWSNFMVTSLLAATSLMPDEPVPHAVVARTSSFYEGCS